MNNITKALSYLLVLFLILTAGGFYYHSTAKEDNNTTPQPTPTQQTETIDDATFISKSQEIFTESQLKWSNELSDGINEKNYCNVEGCVNELPLTDSELNYYVAINGGNIVKFYVTNGTYQFVYNGEGLTIDAITNPTVISEIESDQVITILPNM